ncbi:cupin domain-containing protein [Chiayiivirga flava]|uniref:50S ribosomal protein L16 3-hydroxylase n=1 Tax=Chiayiivirga flava TaxID=659595 RepID=A0A7W8D2E5_9GAMM|nr:cupin domain-containing protein [Chiayiivirga flava]MBB5206666.1 50S ribosomal protein L16 3-hydroxylase [Chiayiivirga flava]
MHTMVVDARTYPPLGMPPELFLELYWQKQPLLIRNAFPHFTAPLTPDDLAGLSLEDNALSRLIRHDPVAETWHVATGPFAEDTYADIGDRDWTLLVQDVDKWDADVAALLPAFDFLPRWRVDDIMVSFAAAGGSVGAHVDHYDVFLLQGLGRRRWQIDASPAPPTAFRDDVELKLLREFTPSHDWILEPGDMLYLPPGVPHHGVALDPCLTFSIGMRAPSQGELLVDLAEHLAESLPESSRYADPDLLPATAAGEIDAAALARVRDALAPLLAAQGDAVGDWFGRFITRYRSAGEIAAPPRPPSRADLDKRLAQGAQLRTHPYARVAWQRSGTGATLFANGDAWPCSVATAARLADRAPLDAAALAALPQEARGLVQTLVERGILAPTRPRSRR